MNVTIANALTWPVDPRFVPVCGFDDQGQPMPLRISSSGGIAGCATEETLAGLKARSFVEGGCDFISSVDGAVSGRDYYGFAVLNEAVITAISVGSGVSGASRLVGATLPAGLTVAADFTGVTLSSGVIQAWKK